MVCYGYTFHSISHSLVYQTWNRRLYAQAAADSLGANNVEAGEGAGSTSAKEITFIGTGYVDPGPDPVPPVEPDPTPPAPEPKPDEDRTGKGLR